MRDSNGWTLGRRIQVVECSGIDSGKVGTVIHHSRISIDGRGVPRLPGYYNSVNWRRDVAVQFDNGELAVLPKSRLGRMAEQWGTTVTTGAKS